MTTLADNTQRIARVESRRSTRIDHVVPIIVLGKSRMGEPFYERTSAVSVNLHGCRFPSRHDNPVGTWISLQLVGTEKDSRPPVVRAQVRSVHPPSNTRELYQFGVELEMPGNVWNIAAPPTDWVDLQFGAAENETATASSAAAVKELPATGSPFPEPPAFVKRGEVTAFPSSPLHAVPKDPNREAQNGRPERVVITADQLIAAVQGKLGAAAEKAVQTAIASQLEEIVRKVMAEARAASEEREREAEERAAQRLQQTVTTAEERIFAQVQARLDEMTGRHDERYNAMRAHSEELGRLVEQTRSETFHELTQTRALAAKPAHDLETSLQNSLRESLDRTQEEMEGFAARVSDRHLVRLTEDKHRILREVTAQLDAHAAETRAFLQSAAGGALEEFRRQIEVQAELAISESTERVKSSLSALDAESRATCEARRRSLESEVTRAAEQSSEQFRKGIKAFLYSCLVAAVSAVDEHAQATLDGLVKDPGKGAQEFGTGANTIEQTGENSR